MPKIHLTTVIHAPVERVFNLARCIKLHQKSMEHTGEKAIGGTYNALIQQGETVVWQAKHLYKNRVLKVMITEMKPHSFFTDEMREGDFKSMKHHHYFKPIANGTIMIDEFMFESPYGLIGKFVNALFLTGYMRNMLQKRNEVIKDYAESHRWKTVLPENEMAG